MISIIPCAGRGKRRLPDTNHTPKILLEHQGDPMIEHIARPIDASGRFERIVFVIGLTHGKQIVEYVRSNPFQTPVKFVIQDEPLGFGHAVLQARKEIFSWRNWNPPVLVHTDDAINRHLVERKSLVKQITDSDTSLLGVQWRNNVRDHGMVIVGENGKTGKRENGKKPDHLPRQNSPSQVQVERLMEKPYWNEGGLCMTGIYFIRESRRLFRCLNKLVKTERKLGGEYQFTHALQLMIEQGTEFKTLYHEWTDAGKQENGKTRKPDGSYEDYLKEIGEIG